MLRRFYVPKIDDSPLELDSEQSRHAQRTLRLTPGTAVELFDGCGNLARARIEAGGRVVRCLVEARDRVAAVEPNLTVAVAMPKGQRADTLIEGLVQVGASRIVPIRCARSVVDPGQTKQRRFERIAIEAAKQSGRAYVPPIDSPCAVAAMFERSAEGDLGLIADAPGGTEGGLDGSPEGRLQNVHAWHAGPIPNAKISGAARVVLLVGPEGGWTDEERQAADAAGFERWRFNPFVLRVETAGLVAAGLIRAAAVSGESAGVPALNAEESDHSEPRG